MEVDGVHWALMTGQFICDVPWASVPNINKTVAWSWDEWDFIESQFKRTTWNPVAVGRPSAFQQVLNQFCTFCCCFTQKNLLKIVLMSVEHFYTALGTSIRANVPNSGCQKESECCFVFLIIYFPRLPVQSMAFESTWFPSELNARPVTVSEWPAITWSRSLRRMSQTWKMGQ